MSLGVAMFLPCRAGSERLADKNTRPFAGRSGGLLAHKLDQLATTRSLDTVVVDSNDPIVLELARARQNTWPTHSTLLIHERPDHLGRPDTTTDDLIAYALASVPCDTLAWTHVTSPFVDAQTYDDALTAFAARDPARHDSLMLVLRLQTFLWQASPTPTPLNYAPTPLRWPRTQDLAPTFEVNSGLFVVPHAVGLARRDRIGDTPILYEVDRMTGLDIDHLTDFQLAESWYHLTGR
jgi:CMP-N-acetylneuraminic acid synthetase